MDAMINPESEHCRQRALSEHASSHYWALSASVQHKGASEMRSAGGFSE